MLFSFLTMQSTTQLQILNKWMYETGVGRIQLSIQASESLPTFTCMTNSWKMKMFECDLSNPTKHKVNVKVDQKYNMIHSVTICARKSLYCLSEIEKSWVRYTNLPRFQVKKETKASVFEKSPELRVIIYDI